MPPEPFLSYLAAFCALAAFVFAFLRTMDAIIDKKIEEIDVNKLVFYTKTDTPRDAMLASLFLEKKLEDDGVLIFSNREIAEMYIQRRDNLRAFSAVLHYTFFSAIALCFCRVLSFGTKFDYLLSPVSGIMDAIIMLISVFCFLGYFFLQRNVRIYFDLYRRYLHRTGID